ncbi:MAG TPA: hypothetical protein VG944_06050, partial [Fimbriimonas sp.]|nr:hypothetical protein [Fimbriimonas sp.]
PVHTVPESLNDPLTGISIPMTTANGYTGVLELSVTQLQLRQTKHSGRNKISLWNERNSIGTWKLAELAGGAESGYIYGRLTAPALSAEVTAGADRTSVASTPETRALQEWCSEIVKELVAQIREARPTESSDKERDKANKALEQMRDLMRRYLDSDQDSDELGDEEGTHGGNGKGKTKTRAVQYGQTVDELVLENGQLVITVAVGSTVRLKCQAFEKSASGDKPVKNYEREFRGSHGVVSIDSHGNLTALAGGDATIYAYAPTFGKSSNEVTIRCLECTSVLALSPDRPLKRNERLEIPYEYFTAERPKGYSDVVLQAWVDPQELAKIGRKGHLSAGMTPGKGRILFQYAADTEPYSLEFEVGEEVVEVLGKGGTHGSDIPLILICGQEAPGYDDRPPLERTQPGGDEYPTIIEDPVQFPNVVWINDRSRESMKVRDTRRSGSGKPCSITSKTFTEFLALKCFDVLKRLKVRKELKDKAVIEREYIQEMVFAEQECSSFVEAAYVLAGAIATDKEE